ncbi:hypothetical protein L2E82_46505 [Cichorium intybus]|uniref:Uncharacterized protein n=1 Tax=Cichorium intybus TaxID=13427 RepID=A0ACB8YTT9_CICIN|nr:hypothetical protein L2E82_46505 [Cichorium intybus]
MTNKSISVLYLKCLEACIERTKTSSEEVKLDLKAAKERLDNDHCRLEKVKNVVEAICEGSCVMLCGPTGCTGKTSLASSIDGALGRKFVRISLGGVKLYMRECV